jgi:NAD(P)-dependent dehydrogenase (short-subunit alcohol dehydrogenase family)
MKFPGLAAYSSAKGAVITLSELLAEEYKEQEIAFNVLAIGAVQTEMLKEAFPDYQAPLSAHEMANYIFDFSLTGNKFYNGKVLASILFNTLILLEYNLSKIHPRKGDSFCSIFN